LELVDRIPQSGDDGLPLIGNTLSLKRLALGVAFGRFDLASSDLTMSAMSSLFSKTSSSLILGTWARTTSKT
jgi:hypothetical protein